MSNQISYLQKKYKKYGTIMIKKDSGLNPVSISDFKELKKYCTNVKKEFIKIGDAGEKNHLLVGRFMTDIKKPKIVRNDTQKSLKILSHEKYTSLIKQILKIKIEQNLFKKDSI